VLRAHACACACVRVCVRVCGGESAFSSFRSGPKDQTQPGWHPQDTSQGGGSEGKLAGLDVEYKAPPFPFWLGEPFVARRLPEACQPYYRGASHNRGVPINRELQLARLRAERDSE
jgi:hypothetical protein